MLTDGQINEFQQLYKNHFGKEISRLEACEEATKLIHLMKAIYKPLTKKDLQNLEK